MSGYLKQKKIYRCSVIAVGHVLEALSLKIEQKYLNFHIQSFPSLENPEIVASIRIDEKGDFGSKEKEKIQLRDASAAIRHLANKYQLEIGVVDQPYEQKLNEIPSQDYTTWLVVYSFFNNPFTWLKVGYLVESLRNEYFHQPEDEDLYIADLCHLDIDQYLNLPIPENRYLQSLIGIQPKNKSAG